MFKPDGDVMVIPFCRAMKGGTGVSQTLGIPQHQIFLKDLQDYFDAREVTSPQLFKNDQEDFRVTHAGL